MYCGLPGRTTKKRIPYRTCKRRPAYAQKAKDLVKINSICYSSYLCSRGVAQPGSASGLGPEGRRFESYRPDHHTKGLPHIAASLFCFISSILWPRHTATCESRLATTAPTPHLLDNSLRLLMVCLVVFRYLRYSFSIP